MSSTLWRVQRAFSWEVRRQPTAPVPTPAARAALRRPSGEVGATSCARGRQLRSTSFASPTRHTHINQSPLHVLRSSQTRQTRVAVTDVPIPCSHNPLIKGPSPSHFYQTGGLTSHLCRPPVVPQAGGDSMDKATTPIAIRHAWPTPHSLHATRHASSERVAV